MWLLLNELHTLTSMSSYSEPKMSSDSSVISKNAQRQPQNQSQSVAINTQSIAAARLRQFATKLKWRACIRAGTKAKTSMAAISSTRQAHRAISACVMRNSTTAPLFRKTKTASQSIVVLKCMLWTTSSRVVCQSISTTTTAVPLNSDAVSILLDHVRDLYSNWLISSYPS